MAGVSNPTFVSDTAQIGTGVVASDEILDDSIVNADINSAAAIVRTKLANVSATARVIGRNTAGAGADEELTLSQILDFIGSATKGDLLVRDTSGWARLAAGASGQVFIAAGAGQLPAWGGGSPMTLLHENSGTNTNITAAVDYDTKAISGLTAKDHLLVVIECEATVQGVDSTALKNNTDTVAITGSLGNIASGTLMRMQILIGPAKSATTKIVSTAQGNTADGTTHICTQLTSTYATDWTGSWTLCLRNVSATNGGTLNWRWKIYKIAGQ